MTLFEIILHQTCYLAWLGVAMSGKLGIEQLIVDGKLEATTIGGHQGDGFDVGLKFLEQLGCQTDSTVGIVSDCTVNQV